MHRSPGSRFPCASCCSPCLGRPVFGLENSWLSFLAYSVTVGSTTLVVDLNQDTPRVDGVHITGYWTEVWAHDSVYGELTDITAGDPPTSWFNWRPRLRRGPTCERHGTQRAGPAEEPGGESRPGSDLKVKVL